MQKYRKKSGKSGECSSLAGRRCRLSKCSKECSGAATRGKPATTVRWDDAAHEARYLTTTRQRAGGAMRRQTETPYLRTGAAPSHSRGPTACMCKRPKIQWTGTGLSANL